MSRRITEFRFKLQPPATGPGTLHHDQSPIWSPSLASRPAHSGTVPPSTDVMITAEDRCARALKPSDSCLGSPLLSSLLLMSLYTTYYYVHETPTNTEVTVNPAGTNKKSRASNQVPAARPLAISTLEFADASRFHFPQISVLLLYRSTGRWQIDQPSRIPTLPYLPPTSPGFSH